ncbi:MAG: cyclase family protein [Gammaproteobacteria bacterium]|nr:cyclase family protein [Gammaproteobacteria bacterium]
MKSRFVSVSKLFLLSTLLLFKPVVQGETVSNEVSKSPWGPKDEIGTLNMMSEISSFEILKRIASGKVYDLGVDLFTGMPNCCAMLGAPDYHFFTTQRPARGDNKELVSLSGDTINTSTHMGTHLDMLNHFGLKGKIWNEVSADDELGSRGWKKSGAEKYPPIIARGILIDVAAAMEVEQLPSSYAISAGDLQRALKKQGSSLQSGDVVLIRTGLMRNWPDPSSYQMGNQAGLGLDAAKWLVEENEVMLLGADNFGLESFPSTNKQNFAPLHTYLLGQRGVSFLEVVWLEDLAKDKVYEFVFIASALKLTGASGSPVRPLAIPVQ